MSIVANWLAPQPTANIANAIRIQARGLTAGMPPSLTWQLSNPGLTVSGLASGHGSRCRPGRGGRPDGRPEPRADADDAARRDAPVRFGPGRGGRHLTVAGQRSPEEAGRGRP